jgi:kumamolisin
VAEPVDPDERVEVSVIVKPRHQAEDLEARLARPMTREEFAASYGADPEDLRRVTTFAEQHELDVVEASQARRTVVLGGRAADVAAAFGVELQRYRLGDGTAYRAPSGPIQVPPEIADIVEGVFGLDTHPIARRH